MKIYEHNESIYNTTIKLLEKNNRAAIIQSVCTETNYITLKVLSFYKHKKKLMIVPNNMVNKYKGFIQDDDVRYMTYKEFSLLKSEELNEINADLLLLNDFQCCCESFWTNNIKQFFNERQAIKILGISSVPIKYLDNLKEVLEQIFLNHIVSDISLGEAMVRKILPSPVYVSALYTLDYEIDRVLLDVKKSKNKNETKELFRQKLAEYNNQYTRNGVRNILTKYINDDMTRFIVLYDDKRDLKNSKSLIKKWFKSFNKPLKLYEVTCENIDGEKNKEIELFNTVGDSESINILFLENNIGDNLNIKDVDCIFLIRESSPPGIYYQEVETIFKINKNKSPLIVDLVNNNHDIKYNLFKLELKDTTLKDKHLEVRVEELFLNIHDENKDFVEIVDEIEKNLLGNWEVMYKRVKEFYESNGNFNVTKEYSNSLLTWIYKQRYLYNQGILEINKVNLLNEINFTWVKGENTWNEFYLKLVKFKKEYNTTNVPKVYKEDQKLSNWVYKQRYNFKNGLLTENRVELLKKIGFTWDSYEESWESSYEKVKDYFLKNNNSNVPYDYKEDVILGRWCYQQRKNYKDGKLSQYKIEKLKEIEFDFEGKEKFFNNSYNELLEYIKKNGHCNVPYDYGNLGRWCYVQRKKYKKNELDEYKVNKLNEVNFSWKRQEDEWDERFELVKSIYNSSESIQDLQLKLKKDYKVYKWCSLQRIAKNGNKLPEFKVEKLESIGFIWNVIDALWEEKYIQVKAYIEENGSTVGMHKNNSLHAWRTKQRYFYKNGKLDEKKALKLIELGVIDKDKGSLNKIQKYDDNKLDEINNPVEEINTSDIDKSAEFKIKNPKKHLNKKRDDFMDIYSAFIINDDIPHNLKSINQSEIVTTKNNNTILENEIITIVDDEKIVEEIIIDTNDGEKIAEQITIVDDEKIVEQIIINNGEEKIVEEIIVDTNDGKKIVEQITITDDEEKIVEQITIDKMKQISEVNINNKQSLTQIQVNEERKIEKNTKVKKSTAANEIKLSRSDKMWNSKFELAKNFYEEKKLNPKSKIKLESSVVKWLDNQKVKCRKKEISDDKIKKLEGINFGVVR